MSMPTFLPTHAVLPTAAAGGPPPDPAGGPPHPLVAARRPYGPDSRPRRRPYRPGRGVPATTRGGTAGGVASGGPPGCSPTDADRSGAPSPPPPP